MKQNFKKKFCEHFHWSFCRISLLFVSTFPCSMFAQVARPTVVRHLQQRGHAMRPFPCTTEKWCPIRRLLLLKSLNQNCNHSLKSAMDLKQLFTLEVVCLVMLWPLHKCTTRSLVVLSWFSQEYIIWYILHLEWAFSVKRKSKFLEIWDWHPKALNRSIFWS